MSEKFTPYFKTPTGESLARSSVAKDFRQENLNNFLGQIRSANPRLDQEIQIRVVKD